MGITISPQLLALLKQLSTTLPCHRDSLAQELEISLQTLSRMVSTLQDYGLPIECLLEEEYYHLSTPCLLLDKEWISQELSSFFSQEQKDLPLYHVLQSCDSTNTLLKSAPPDRRIHICLSEYQSGGRGRFERHWHSPFAQNICCSLLIPVEKIQEHLGGLSLALSLSIIQTLESLWPAESPRTDPLCCKWPNDLIYQDRKMGGMLIEVEHKGPELYHLIIGFGINVNMMAQADRLPAISQPWHSLAMATGCVWDRNPLCVAFIKTLCQDFFLFQKEGLSPFLSRWQKHDYLFGKKIVFSQGEQSLEGIAAGITPQGLLRLETAKGAIISCASGESRLIRPI